MTNRKNSLQMNYLAHDSVFDLGGGTKKRNKKKQANKTKLPKTIQTKDPLFFLFLFPFLPSEHTMLKMVENQKTCRTCSVQSMAAKAKKPGQTVPPQWSSTSYTAEYLAARPEPKRKKKRKKKTEVRKTTQK